MKEGMYVFVSFVMGNIDILFSTQHNISPKKALFHAYSTYVLGWCRVAIFAASRRWLCVDRVMFHDSIQWHSSSWVAGSKSFNLQL